MSYFPIICMETKVKEKILFVSGNLCKGKIMHSSFKTLSSVDHIFRHCASILVVEFCGSTSFSDIRGPHHYETTVNNAPESSSSAHISQTDLILSFMCSKIQIIVDSNVKRLLLYFLSLIFFSFLKTNSKVQWTGGKLHPPLMQFRMHASKRSNFEMRESVRRRELLRRLIQLRCRYCSYSCCWCTSLSATFFSMRRKARRVQTNGGQKRVQTQKDQLQQDLHHGGVTSDEGI